MPSRITGAANSTITEISEPSTNPTDTCAKPLCATDRIGRDTSGK